MARVTHVKRAQQRYQTVPVIDPATGEPRKIPVMGKNGAQKTSKRGPVFRTVTVEDKTKPLPNEKCGKCGKEIEPGMPYKWIAPKSGPYGGQRMVRCEVCPTWNVWEYSSSLSARVAEISHNFSEAFSALDPTGEDIDEDYEVSSILEDVQSALNDVAEAIRELASEKEEGASNIEDGFGHETSQSQELRDTAEQLESWADEVENTDLPSLDDVSEHKSTCEACEGSGEVSEEEAEDGEGVQPCEVCDGTGEVFDEEEAAQAVADWWSEVESAATEAVDNCPV